MVWFAPIPQGQTAADFRTQRYHGRRVLTWWQGTGLGGLSDGTDYVYDDHFRQIATVKAGNGLTTDGHEPRRGGVRVATGRTLLVEDGAGTSDRADQQLPALARPSEAPLGRAPIDAEGWRRSGAVALQGAQVLPPRF